LVRDVIVVGGGTAGWITAAYLAQRLNVGAPGGARVSVIEAPDIPTIGVGEGSFPSIRKMLQTIGIDEIDLVSEAGATFKQGIRFNDWCAAPGHHYFHPFQVSDSPDGLDLLPYCLLGVAGDAPWAGVNTVQKAAADANLGPKLANHPGYAGPLNYAYHFDATRLGSLLRQRAVALGARHVVDTVVEVPLAEDGSIAHLVCRQAGAMQADLYVDCTGFRAQLIGGALGAPFHSRRSELFVDRAVAIQIPYARPNAPIPSQTFASARGAGWIWDIGLHERRGTGYVYSSAHINDEQAERTLREYLGSAANDLPARKLQFEAGYRHLQWSKNCVAIGLSSGFIEPLEATGIGFAEIAAHMLVNLFPWAGGGEMEVSARQFNAIMVKRYDHVVDFIKLHYCLSDRDDTSFWRENRDRATWSPALIDKLERWHHRAPDFMDVDLNHDIFLAANWQYVLYGMGYRTDLSAQAGGFRFHEDAARAFADLKLQQAAAVQRLPSHRALVTQLSSLRR
jgi:tryptophan halogenase